jgi:uncharacterized 2Fe-2S/4Fe-4S cluster protein (DUF4445 family)
MQLKVGIDKVIEIDSDKSIYETLKKNKIFIVSPCGGKGTCGKCKIQVIKGDHVCNNYGQLSSSDKDNGMVLACQTFAHSDLEIEIPKESALVVGDKIATSKLKDLSKYLETYGVTQNPFVKKITLQLQPPSITDNTSDIGRLQASLSEHNLNNIHFSHILSTNISATLRLHNWNIDASYITRDNNVNEVLLISGAMQCSKRFGVAVDIGTTTVVVYMVDLDTGKIIDVGSTYNSQMRYGDDVITRIVHATEGGGLDELRSAVRGDIKSIVKSLMEIHNIMTCEVVCTVISANTTMSQLFWGLDPASIREAPYIPTLNKYPVWTGAEARLPVSPMSPVYTFPCIGSYVGGDIVSGVLASGMHRKEEIALFMDIGTNAEIAIGNNEWIMSAACSAGPCFEGGGVTCGMRATVGAIESISIDRTTLEPTIKVIGGGAPIGLCGSALIDAISEMFISGIIDLKGSFHKDKTKRIRQAEAGLEYLVYSDDNIGRDIVITSADIENVIRAKAAIYAGVSLILREVGLTIDAVDKVYIAGGFGNYLNMEKAIIIGMLPDMPVEKFDFIGNSSIIGAYLALMSEELMKEADELSTKMTYLELSANNSYMDEYMSAMFLPHTSISQFPTVQEILKNSSK